MQITWSRLPGDTSPYTVLTIGDTKYSNNQRVAIEKPIRHDVSLNAGNWRASTKQSDALI